MVTKIQKVALRASQLFRGKVAGAKVSVTELEELKDMVNTVTASDVNVNEAFLQKIGINKV